MSYFRIYPPVNRHSRPEDIRLWIKALLTLKTKVEDQPDALEAIEEALDEARDWLASADVLEAGSFL
jgi:hypothetical protein